MLINSRNISELFVQCPKCNNLNVEELYSIDITDESVANSIECCDCGAEIYFKTKLSVSAEIVNKP